MVIDSVLMQVRESLSRYIQVIQSFFAVEVDICDHNLIRIAGTGRYGIDIGKKAIHSNLSTKAIASRDIVLVFNPAQEEPCRSCEHRPFCGNFARMIFPLLHNGEVYGAISLTALNADQSRDLLVRKEKFILFMQSICELITLKVLEYQERRREAARQKLQERLVEAIADGVMVLDDDDVVRYINRRGEKILGCDIRQIRLLTRELKFAIQHVRTLDGVSEYLVRIRRSKIRLSGRVFESDGRDGKNRIFIFADMRTLQENLTPGGGPLHCTFDEIIGRSPAFMETVAACKKVAFHQTPVLLYGEVAVGKEVFARAIHNEGPFRHNKFIRVVRGVELQALVDWEGRDPGRTDSNDFTFKADLLDGNTIYVDEVGDFILENQCIILALMQQARQLNTRVICSTSRELEPMVERGEFHPELYYSLEMYFIPIPPMRERGGDIALLAAHYLDIANRQMRRNISLSKEVLAMFMAYPWRGNVREIDNTVAFLVEDATSDEMEMTPELLPPSLKKKFADKKKRDYNLENAEKRLIVKALNDAALSAGSRATVARELGISNATLYRKLKQYDIKENVRFD